ncbi:VOC family protein [Lactococcus garvieae]
MSTKVFVNFPVTNIKVSTNFYEKLGFKKNNDFSDDLVSCMVWDENFYIMLLSHERYQEFIGDKTIADTHKVSGALAAFTLPGADAVKEFGKLASQHGGQSLHLENGIPEDVMYGLEVQDPDGNCLEPVWMAM